MSGIEDLDGESLERMLRKGIQEMSHKPIEPQLYLNVSGMSWMKRYLIFSGIARASMRHRLGIKRSIKKL